MNAYTANRSLGFVFDCTSSASRDFKGRAQQVSTAQSGQLLGRQQCKDGSGNLHHGFEALPLLCLISLAFGNVLGCLVPALLKARHQLPINDPMEDRVDENVVLDEFQGMYV